MSLQDKQWVIRKYEERFERYGVSTDTICWENRWAQELRFRILLEVGIKSGMRVLDVGCGFGDFYSYLEKCGVLIDYEGYDISEKLLESARKLHPKARFKLFDILESEVSDAKYDYVVSSGVLNHRVQDNWKFVKAFLFKMFSLCKIGIAANMVTTYHDKKSKLYDDLYYYQPEKVFTFCQTLSCFLTLRHDYPLNEFTVYIYREDAGLGRFKKTS